MKTFKDKLISFLHDPIDKCFSIPSHQDRARDYANTLGINAPLDTKGADQVASCMERSFLPKNKVYQNFTEVRHPLSEGFLTTNPNNLNIGISLSSGNVSGNVQAVFGPIYAKKAIELSNFGNNDKSKFIYLWRVLEHNIINGLTTQQLKEWIPILPADTRVPDHSIWEHLKITTALDEKNSLFLFTLGPVQSFISQARKTQDFYMGSFILSFLTFKAMEVIIDRYGPTNIIYPDLYKQPLMDWWINKNIIGDIQGISIPGYKKEFVRIPTIPNRFVAFIPTVEGQKIKVLAEDMKKEIKIVIEGAMNTILEGLLRELINENQNKLPKEEKDRISSGLCKLSELEEERNSILSELEKSRRRILSKLSELEEKRSSKLSKLSKLEEERSRTLSELSKLEEEISKTLSELQEERRKILSELSKLEEERSRILSRVFEPEEGKSKLLSNKILSQLSDFPEIYWVAVPIINAYISSGLEDKEIYDMTCRVLNENLKNFFCEGKITNYRELLKKLKDEAEFPPNIGILYELIYSALEKSMGARKNVRTFSQPKVEEKGRKCSVCGERDVIFFCETRNKRKFTEYNSPTIDLTGKIPLKFLADGEGLCAVCFLKRTFEKYLEKEVSEKFRDLTFPSTAEIACADFKEKFLSERRGDFRDYVRELKNFGIPKVEFIPKLMQEHNNVENIDGSFFFKENITAEYFEKNVEGFKSSQENQNKINEISRKLEDLYEKIKYTPNPYYAIIHLDGDNMGKWLSGALLPSIENAYNSVKREEDNNPQAAEEKRACKSQVLDQVKSFLELVKGYLPVNIWGQPRKLLTPAIHASISVALRNYAIEFVRKIVEEEHLGKLVYAGGDDVLAFVNLRDLFDVMEKLRWAFSGQIKIDDQGKVSVDLNNKTGFVEKDGVYLLTMGARATASMGVAVAHYKTPLQLVIRKAFEMEKKAKDNGKDSFAISFMRRSGEERDIVYKWLISTDDGGKTRVIEEIKKLIEKFRDNKISRSFVSKLYESIHTLADKDGFVPVEGNTREMLKVEIERVLSRSSDLDKNEYEEVMNIMKNLVLANFQEYSNEQGHSNGQQKFNFGNFTNTLAIIRGLVGGKE